MTISAQCLWEVYRKKVGGTNHDGTFELPKHVSGLGPEQQAAWQECAYFCNRHTTEEIRKDRERRDHQREERYNDSDIC